MEWLKVENNSIEDSSTVWYNIMTRKLDPGWEPMTNLIGNITYCQENASNSIGKSFLKLPDTVGNLRGQEHKHF